VFVKFGLQARPCIAVLKAMTIDELNSLDWDHFVRAVGWTFEDSPWVAERAWHHRPFSNLDHLHRVMVEEVEAGLPEERLALLRAHPDLGTRARISESSASEQAGAGLDNLTAGEFDRLKKLNADYRDKFGIPFMFAVKGRTKYDILGALEERLHGGLEQEYQEAFRQVYRIARFRLEDSID
jgi:2-oxo-4-hydroxy-4-carboxy-5-ureidoimidazoline decarboxylase